MGVRSCSIFPLKSLPFLEVVASVIHCFGANLHIYDHANHYDKKIASPPTDTIRSDISSSQYIKLFQTRGILCQCTNIIVVDASAEAKEVISVRPRYNSSMINSIFNEMITNLFLVSAHC